MDRKGLQCWEKVKVGVGIMLFASRSLVLGVPPSSLVGLTSHVGKSSEVEPSPVLGRYSRVIRATWQNI